MRHKYFWLIKLATKYCIWFSSDVNRKTIIKFSILRYWKLGWRWPIITGFDFHKKNAHPCSRDKRSPIITNVWTAYHTLSSPPSFHHIQVNVHQSVKDFCLRIIIIHKILSIMFSVTIAFRLQVNLWHLNVEHFHILCKFYWYETTMNIWNH